MSATKESVKEVVEELIDFKNWVTGQMDEYERTGKKYYYPDPENIIGELDARIDKLNDQLIMEEIAK